MASITFGGSDDRADANTPEDHLRLAVLQVVNDEKNNAILTSLAEKRFSGGEAECDCDLMEEIISRYREDVDTGRRI